GGDVAVRSKLHAQVERVLVAIATDHRLRPRHAGHPPGHLVDLAGMNEHATNLGDLVSAPAPSQHPGAGATTRTRRLGEDAEVAGAEPDHRVGAVVDGTHDLPDLAGR